MSVKLLQKRLMFALSLLWVELLGYLLLTIAVLLALGLRQGSQRSQNLKLHNLCSRNSSLIGALEFLQSEKDD